jgi:cytochrome P450
MALLLVLLTIPVAILIYRFTNFLQNYIDARRLGIPIIFSPVSWQDSWWVPLAQIFTPFRHLPFSLGSWIFYSTMGWTLEDRYHAHEKYGAAFVIVSPRKNEIFVADPVACEELLSQWRIWTKCEEIYKIFDVFGKNVNTVNGDVWTRHRKITSYGFKEANNKVVWEEALFQARDLGKSWASKDIDMKRVVTDFGTVALHVLSAAAFGKRHGFDSGYGSQHPEPGHQLSFGDSLRTIMHNLMFTILFDGIKAPNFMLPGTLKSIKLATIEFRQYLQEFIAMERDLLANGGGERDSLAAIMVSANEEEKVANNDEKKKGMLTDDELVGNLFMMNLAGHETTAGTLTYALPLIAVNPGIQSWLQDEIDAHFRIDLPYAEVYPGLVRCLAVMYETVRLYGPIAYLNRTGVSSQSASTLNIPSLGRELTIPSSTYLNVNLQALHTNPTVWGSDSLQFNPKRWIATNNDKVEILSTPPGATFVGWSHGPRACPGQKFSKVEFVGVLASLLRVYDVLPTISVIGRRLDANKEASETLRGIIEDSFFFMVPKMRRAGEGGVRLVERG